MRQILPIPLLALMLLSACAETPQPSAAPPSEPPALPAPAADPLVIKPAPPPKPIVRPPSKAANPEELIGLDRSGVSKMLGEPSETSDQAGARILTYRGKDCALSVILFFDVKAGTERVLSYELTPPRRAKGCYKDLRVGK